ncbi:hypothetical protein CKO28_05230 [Rhodovibrio sodomensis]|uniref:PAS domain-containing protein n=1 Tax=Rhodovibrio sodomensis TaxID=1088 RepID=A0ABS1DBX5_9PROT|nr:PAS domain-containing protein [Rhodovibrio sodomensis]MBK1667432.1 hypothetical protein [Rhodovibrio sodomensis]
MFTSRRCPAAIAQAAAHVPVRSHLVSFNVTLQPSLPVAPASPRLRAFHAYWRGLAPAGAVPAYRGFDVVHVPRDLLAFLLLLEVLDGGADFRYRVVGTGVVDAIGRDFTGETVSEYRHRHEPPGVADGYRRVCSLQAPDLYQGTLESVGKGFIRYERLALPFADDSGRVGHVLACFQFERAAG